MLCWSQHRCSVHSLVVLLTKEAQTTGLAGEWIRNFEGETPYRYLRYQVIRAWEFRAEELRVVRGACFRWLPCAKMQKNSCPA